MGIRAEMSALCPENQQAPAIKIVINAVERLEGLHGSGESLVTVNTHLTADLHRIREQRDEAIKRAWQAEAALARKWETGAALAKQYQARIDEIEKLKAAEAELRSGYSMRGDSESATRLAQTLTCALDATRLERDNATAELAHQNAINDRMRDNYLLGLKAKDRAIDAQREELKALRAALTLASEALHSFFPKE
jgi:hypothetical protein